MKKKLVLLAAGLCLAVIMNAQTPNTSPLPAGETVIGGHLHAGAGNEIWTDNSSLYFNYRGSATATYFWNLEGGTGKSIMTLLNNGNVGIGTNNPLGTLHLNANAPYLYLTSTNTSEPFAALRGNGGTWLFGYGGISGNEDISIGTQDGTGQRTITFATGGSAKIKILSNGNVGIGNTSPIEKLHVNGNLFLQATEMEGSWLRTNLYYSGHHLVIGSKVGTYCHNNIMIRPGGAVEGKLVSQLQLYTANGIENYSLNVNIASEGITFFNGGNVLIGKTSQDNSNYKLDVAGSIRANEIKVNTTGADFVFEPNYKLRPLSEVETFIKANKHLPDVAPAADMQTNGVSMGEMQSKLLQKVEELTLYSIEQNKQLQEQRQSNADVKQQLAEQTKQNAELKQRIDQLEQLITQKLK